MGAPPDYVDVATRVAEFRETYPTGSLQQVEVKFLDFAGKSWVVYTAAAYRTPDDPRPGHGTAWEPVPGPTNFTRDSELQNAETSAWGRALIAVLAADSKRGVASADEVRNRTAAPAETPAHVAPMLEVRGLLRDIYKAAGGDAQNPVYRQAYSLVKKAGVEDLGDDAAFERAGVETLAGLVKELEELSDNTENMT